MVEKIKRIDLLMPESSQYGVLHQFTRELGLALITLSYDCRFIENEDIWKIPIKDPPDLTIGFNGAPQHPSGFFLADLIERPHLCCLMDIAYRYFPLLESPYIHFTCNDLFSCHLLELKQQNALFLPPGVPYEISNQNISKEFDIVLLTTFIDFESRQKNWKKQFPPSICALMEQTVEKVFSNSETHYIEAFQSSFNDFLAQRKLKDEQFNLYTAWEQLELYIRGYERVALVKALSDFTIHVFDSSVDQTNWEKYFQGKLPNLVFHPPVSFKESFEILKKSKFVLNSSPHLRLGAHERVLNTLACGALPITEKNPYMQKIFTDKELIFYQHPHLNQLPDILAMYQDHNKWNETVEAGRKKVLSSHTWKTRADTISDFLSHMV